MPKRDPIFWWATAIFVLALVLGATVDPSALVLMAFAYLLRPTLLAVGLGRRYADERQLTIQYHSGNVAFTILVGALIVVAFGRERSGQPADVFWALICIGLAAKALANRLLGRQWRSTGITIVMTVGLLMMLFGFLEEGPSLAGVIHSVPGILAILLGALGFRFPRVAGVLIALAAVGAIYWFHLLTMRQLPTFLLLAVPLFISAACLYFGPPEEGARGEGH